MYYNIDFSLALIFEIQAIGVSLIIFLYFAQNSSTRIKRHHHSWLVLLILNFFQLLFDIPVALAFYYRGIVWPESNAFCTWWTWFSFSLDTTALFLCVWISIERHLLIFYSQTLSRGRWRKWIFHIAPIIICCIWAPIVYFVLIVISTQCVNEWDFETLLCGPPCYTYTGFLGAYDFLFNVCTPLLIVALVNMILVIRVIKSKRAHQSNINWRHHRKMILQFWAISSLHVALWFPLVLASLVQMTIMPSFLATEYTTLEYILYYMPMFLPVTCLWGIPDLVNKITDFFRSRRLNLIGVSNGFGAMDRAPNMIVR